MTNISFTIFDIDLDNGGNNSGFADLINNISATDGTNTYYATVSGSTTNSASGSGTSGAQIVGTSGAADNTNNGNGTISFGTNAITSFTFRYGNNTATSPNNPGNQGIGIGDLNYIPEPSSWITAFLLVGAVGFHCYRTAKRRAVVAGLLT